MTGGAVGIAAAAGGCGKLEVRCHPAKGRCLFARAPIGVGELIEAAPAIVLSAADCAALDGTALALGYVGLCNHSARPRAKVRRNYADSTLDLVALADIAIGEEVTIDYNCPLWFDVSE